MLRFPAVSSLLSRHQRGIPSHSFSRRSVAVGRSRPLSKRTIAAANDRTDETDEYETTGEVIDYLLSTLKKSYDLVDDPWYREVDCFSRLYLRFRGFVACDNLPSNFMAIKEVPESLAFVGNLPFSKRKKGLFIEHLLRLKRDFRIVVPQHVLQRDWWRELLLNTPDCVWTIYIPNRILLYHKKGVVEPHPRFASIIVACDREPGVSTITTTYIDWPSQSSETFEVRDKKRLGQPIVTPTPTPAAAAAVAAAANATGE